MLDWIQIVGGGWVSVWVRGGDRLAQRPNLKSYINMDVWQHIEGKHENSK